METTPGDVHLVKVDHDDPRAIAQRRQLDEDLDERYRGFNIDEDESVVALRRKALRVDPAQLVATWIAVDADHRPIGHVQLRRLGDEWELKRLTVRPRARGRGIGRRLVDAVVGEARSGGAERLILQSGLRQPESLALYAAMGFSPIPVYEPYVATMPRSLCFELPLAEPAADSAIPGARTA